MGVLVSHTGLSWGCRLFTCEVLRRVPGSQLGVAFRRPLFQCCTKRRWVSLAHCSVPQHLPCFSHLGFGTERFILVVSEVNSLRHSPGLRAGSGLPAPALHLGDLGLAHTDDSTGPASGRSSSSSAQAADPLAPRRGLLLPRDAPARGPSALLADAPFRLPGSACARPPRRSHPRGCRGRQSPRHLPFVIQPCGTAPSLDLDTSGAYFGLTFLADGRANGLDGATRSPADRGPGRAGCFPGSPSWPRRRRARAASPEFRGALAPQGRWLGAGGPLGTGGLAAGLGAAGRPRCRGARTVPGAVPRRGGCAGAAAPRTWRGPAPRDRVGNSGRLSPRKASGLGQKILPTGRSKCHSSTRSCIFDLE